MAEETIEIAQQNYTKVITNARKVGYREGIIDGKDTMYQHYFDMGYQEGFRNAKTLALHKANTQLEIIEPGKGLCQLCEKPELRQNHSVQNVINKQNTVCQQIMLKNKH